MEARSRSAYVATTASKSDSCSAAGVELFTGLSDSPAGELRKPGERYTNRTPRSDEIEANVEVLRAVIWHFESQGAAVVAVGRVAERTLQRLGIAVRAQVQHPAYGGAPKFRAGLAELAHESLG